MGGGRRKLSEPLTGRRRVAAGPTTPAPGTRQTGIDVIGRRGAGGRQCQLEPTMPGRQRRFIDGVFKSPGQPR